jgi:Golgi apparatus protein 1
MKSPDCRAALLRLMMSAADNYLLDAPLAAACSTDVATHCAATVPGQGRVHECLRDNAPRLSPACRLAEVAAEAEEMEDIRLKPQLLEACDVTAAAVCGGIKPGNGRLLECLLNKVKLKS